MTSSSTDVKEIRKFGLIAFLFFGLLCILAIWREKVLVTCFFGTLSFLGIGFLICPGPLKPVYNAWQRIAHFIGKGITIIMLTLAYYLVITPAALIKRWVNGSPIPLKPDKNESTYWVTRPEAAQPKERFLKRF